MASISFRKPISIIVSTSSTTRVVTLDKSTVLFLTCSSNLPGVATKISTPFAIFLACSVDDTPPKTVVFSISKYFEKSSIAFDIWVTNSLVGAIINALNGWFELFVDVISSIIGKTNAAVFPEPLCAVAKISFLFKATGIAFFWISVGFSNCKSSRAWIILVSKLIELNALIIIPLKSFIYIIRDYIQIYISLLKYNYKMLNFPINEVIPSIKNELKNNTKLIIEAPAGAGKSTIVPISLLNESWLEDKIIIVLEPRRVAARAVATQMARLLGEDIGKTVGYQVKMESKFSKDTKILVVTEGILVRKLQNDQELEDVACVIFDEFHERSIHTDLSLALSLQCQEMLREDLKIVLMSATLNSNKLISLLGDVSLVKSDGRMFDVEAIYLQESIKHTNSDNIT